MFEDSTDRYLDTTSSLKPTIRRTKKKKNHFGKKHKELTENTELHY